MCESAGASFFGSKAFYLFKSNDVTLSTGDNQNKHNQNETLKPEKEKEETHDNVLCL